MSDDKYSMHGEDHIQQFPNAEDYLHNEGNSRHNWWELPETEKPEGYASGGSVISRLRKRKNPDIGPMPIHPAMNIPGVHIRTAEAGEPFFYGDK
jgi:hypothetical protein